MPVKGCFSSVCVDPRVNFSGCMMYMLGNSIVSDSICCCLSILMCVCVQGLFHGANSISPYIGALGCFSGRRATWLPAVH